MGVAKLRSRGEREVVGDEGQVPEAGGLEDRPHVEPEAVETIVSSTPSPSAQPTKPANVGSRGQRSTAYASMTVSLSVSSAACRPAASRNPIDPSITMSL